MAPTQNNLTEDERKLIASIKAKKSPRYRALMLLRNFSFFYIALIGLVTFYVFTLGAIGQGAPRTRYADCQILLSATAHNVEKLKIITRYFPEKPVCRLKTDYYKANNVFAAGHSDIQLVLPLSSANLYQLNARSLLLALAPDKDRIPPTASLGMLQMVGAINDLAAGHIDLPRLMGLLKQSGELASYMAENAEILKKQLQALPEIYGVPAQSVPVPMWLDSFIALKQFKPVVDTRAQQNAPALPQSFTPKSILDWIKKMGGI